MTKTYVLTLTIEQEQVLLDHIESEAEFWREVAEDDISRDTALIRMAEWHVLHSSFLEQMEDE